MRNNVLRLKDRVVFNQNYDAPLRVSSKDQSNDIRDQVYNKTNGRCYYCGNQLNRPGWDGPKKQTFTIDHKIPKGAGGSKKLNNLVPCCKKCNNSKGMNSVEGFRWIVVKQKFEQENGIKFSDEQFKWLGLNGFRIELPVHKFWFEDSRKGDES